MSDDKKLPTADPVAEIVNRYGRRASSARKDPSGHFWQRLAESVSREATVSREVVRVGRPPPQAAVVEEQVEDQAGAPDDPPELAPLPPAKRARPAAERDDDEFGDLEVELGAPLRAPADAKAQSAPRLPVAARERAPSAPALPVVEGDDGAALIEIALPDGSTLALVGRRVEGADGRPRLHAADAPGNPRWLLDALSALARGTHQALQRVATERGASSAAVPVPPPAPRLPTGDAPAVARDAKASAGPDTTEGAEAADAALPDDLALPEALLAALAEGAAAGDGEAPSLWDGLPPLPGDEAVAPSQEVAPEPPLAPRSSRPSVRLGGAAAERAGSSTAAARPALRSESALPTPPSPTGASSPPTAPGRRRRPSAASPAEAPSRRVRPARAPLLRQPEPPASLTRVPTEAGARASSESRAVASPAVPPAAAAGDERARTRDMHAQRRAGGATGAAPALARDSARAPGLAVGIDLGHSYVRMGLMREEMELLGDAQDRRALPVVAGFPEPDEMVLGWEARELRGERPELTVTHFTRLLGLSLEEAERDQLIDQAGLPVRSDDAGALVFEVHGRELRATRLVTLLLAQLRATAAAALGGPVTEAVVSVPLGLAARQRELLVRAAGRAGWENTRLLDAPWAALRAWGLDQHPGRVAVYDLGGTSFEFCVLQTGPSSQRRVLGMASEAGIGSMLLEAALAGRVAERFARATGIDLRARPAAWQLLLAACEDAKCQLSERNVVQVMAGELLAPNLLAEAQHSMGVPYRLTRKELGELAGAVVDRSLGVVVRVLAQAGVAAQELSAVVLCGGGALSPLVRGAVAAFFERVPWDHDAQLAGVHGAASLAAAGANVAAGLTAHDG